MNKIILVGRIATDIEKRETPNGKVVANFRLATNRPFDKENADFHNIQVWGKPAENVAKYQQKGSQLGVEGRIQYRSYENKEGQTVWVTEVVADSVEFLGGGSGGKGTDSKPKDEIDISDDKLPF